MAVTLAQAKLGTQEALQIGVIDEFAKSNYIMGNMPFKDCVSPTGGGGTLTYAYTRVTTQPTAAFREINSEYAPQEAQKERISVDLKVFGGAFEIDRVIGSLGGVAEEAGFQMQQKIKAASALFNDTVINGDSASDSLAFDGLDKALTGSSTEFNAGIGKVDLDLSSSAAITKNYMTFLDMLDEFMMGLSGTPDMLAGNTKMISKIRAAARRAGMYQITPDAFGRQVEYYGATAIVDLGAKAGLNDPVVATDAAGVSSLYAARFGLDGLHGVSLAGQAPVRAWLPDFSVAGAVKRGEVEMVAAIALAASRAAGVFRNIKVK